MSVARFGVNGGNFYSNLTDPVQIDCNFVVDATNGNGLGIRSLKSNGWVRNVFMHTTASPGSNDGYLNPNPAAGYAMIQMKQNFNKYIGGPYGFVSPLTGGALPITGALTAGLPYVITSVGAVPAPKFTVTTVADIAGSLAGKYFTVSDAFSNNFVFYNVVSGVGLPPSLTGVLTNYVAIPVAFATNAANTAVATAVSTAVAAVNGGNSFTTGVVGAIVTITSAANPNLKLSPAPQDVNTGFTVSAIVFTSLTSDWDSVGLQPGLIPTLGQTFVATSAGGALGSGTVKLAGVSGITSIEVIGNPNSSINNSSIATYGGAWITVQFLAATAAGNTALIPTAPAPGSVVAMSFLFDGSNVSVDGL